ncbi:hypothetical protein ElyMa_005019700 [Elysia marginata]|uniref:Uncharacterized protein n=1 Tax=Elysia marginata TaxID=1093978 RepID=A0AAV4JAC4_9GAST|nr:hypothetical protein ElyMa_005019700 [Elysia marginata]
MCQGDITGCMKPFGDKVMVFPEESYLSGTGSPADGADAAGDSTVAVGGGGAVVYDAFALPDDTDIAADGGDYKDAGATGAESSF